jgi:hypothetical protein
MCYGQYKARITSIPIIFSLIEPHRDCGVFPEHFCLLLSLCPISRQAPPTNPQRQSAREEIAMNCILELLVTLFEVIQDTGTGT